MEIKQKQTDVLIESHFGLARKTAPKSPDKVRLHYDTQDRLAALQQRLGGSFDGLVAVAVRQMYADVFDSIKVSEAASLEVGQVSHDTTTKTTN